MEGGFSYLCTMPTCHTHKRSYPTQEMAEDALVEARIRFVHNSAAGVYQCDECGEWHLTSQGEMNPRLKKLLDDGTLKKEREAFNWERKLKK